MSGLLDRLFGRSIAPKALAHVYLRQDRLFIHPNDRTPEKTAGFWIGAEPVVTLGANVPDADLGAAVVQALQQSRLEVPIPERGADLEAPLRRAAGVRSYRALMVGTRSCAVARERGRLLITPYHNGGSSGEERGYTPITEAVIELDAAVAAERVGEAVRAALARATLGERAREI